MDRTTRAKPDEVRGSDPGRLTFKLTRGKGDAQMKSFFLITLSCLFIFGCTYSQNMINPEGQTVRCSSYGWGFIGGPMAINILNDCIQSHKQMGYVEVENVGVPGFYLTEGNPPSISKIQPGWPAQKAGMLAGDKILSVNGTKVTSMKEVFLYGFCKPGEVINFEVQRGNELKSFSVTTAPKAKKSE